MCTIGLQGTVDTTDKVPGCVHVSQMKQVIRTFGITKRVA
jgi:hypothetical protein